MYHKSSRSFESLVKFFLITVDLCLLLIILGTAGPSRFGVFLCVLCLRGWLIRRTRRFWWHLVWNVVQLSPEMVHYFRKCHSMLLDVLLHTQHRVGGGALIFRGVSHEDENITGGLCSPVLAKNLHNPSRSSSSPSMQACIFHWTSAPFAPSSLRPAPGPASSGVLKCLRCPRVVLLVPVFCMLLKACVQRILCFFSVEKLIAHRSRRTVSNCTHSKHAPITDEGHRCLKAWPSHDAVMAGRQQIFFIFSLCRCHRKKQQLNVKHLAERRHPTEELQMVYTSSTIFFQPS